MLNPIKTKVAKTKIITIFAFIITMLFTTTAIAVDLIEVYKQALVSDPKYQSEQALYLSETQAYPQARALLLPQLSLDGKYLYQKFNSENTLLDAEFRSFDYKLTLTQSVFDFGKWSNLHIARSDVKAAAANFAAAEQDLILRTATAYFNVLEAEDNLRFTRAEKRATARQLDQAEQRFKVGLDAITSVYDARAEYDANVAQEIAAKNDVVNAREQLREITGRYYKNLSKLTGRLLLAKPQPVDVEKWVEAIDKQNLAIIAARFRAQAARDNIKLQFSGHLPVVNAVGSFEKLKTRGIGGGVLEQSGGIPLNSERIDAGVQVDLPIFQGGLVLANTRQAKYDYQKAVSDLENIHRQNAVATRQTYNDITSGISKIKADKQAIISRESSVKSQEAALQVGTRTIVDVLNAQRDLFETQKILAADQYKYINDSLRLKSLAGTLNIDDLRIVNSWLHPSRDKAAYHKKAIPHKIEALETHKAPKYVKKPKTKPKAKLVKRTKSKPTRVAKQVNSQVAKKQIKKAPSQATVVQPIKRYSIQLMASVDKRDVLNFVKKYHLQDKISYYRVHAHGRDWYAAFYGKYASTEEAHSVLRQLSPQLRKLNPWIRRLV